MFGGKIQRKYKGKSGENYFGGKYKGNTKDNTDKWVLGMNIKEIQRKFPRKYFWGRIQRKCKGNTKGNAKGIQMETQRKYKGKSGARSAPKMF